MADRIPVKAIYSGLDVTALGEFTPTDTIALSIISGFPAGVTLELGNNSIDALSDVSVPTPANNEVLTFNSTSGNWEASVSPGSSAAIWGNITGTLSDQLDLQLALDGKANVIHTHLEADITDLQPYLLDITAEPIGDLSDVTIVTPTNGDVLTFNAGVWSATAPTGGGVAWGTITGTLSDQPDLQTALNLKVETASNIGTGAGVFAQKVAIDLEFKTLVAGDGIVVTPSATEILIDNRREVFFAHNGATAQTFAAALITVLFPTIVRSDPAYTYNAGTITVNASGWYLITYQMSADNSGNSRAQSRTGISVNSTTVQVPGSFGWAYHRTAVAGEGSFSGTVLVNLTAGDIIRIMTQRISGNTALSTLAEGCRIMIVATGAP